MRDVSCDIKMLSYRYSVGQCAVTSYAGGIVSKERFTDEWQVLVICA
jgi:hypothetical protein